MVFFLNNMRARKRVIRKFADHVYVVLLEAMHEIYDFIELRLMVGDLTWIVIS